MPGSPTAQDESILGAGSQGRVPPPGWGMLQTWVRRPAPAHPASGAQRDRHLPATQQNPSLTSKGKKSRTNEPVKTQALGAARGPWVCQRGCQACPYLTAPQAGDMA